MTIKSFWTLNLSHVSAVFAHTVIFLSTLYVGTEILSALSFINRGSTLSLVFFALSLLWLLRRWIAQISRLVQSQVVPQQMLLMQKQHVLFFVLPFILTAVQGFWSAPNTSDAMIYHLPRAMFWIEQGSIWQDVIFTPHDFMPPFSGILFLHLSLFFDSDRFLFLSQWFAAVLSSFLMLFFSLWAYPRKSFGWRDFLYLSLPMLLLQAASTQIDLLLNALVLLNLYYGLAYVRCQNMNIGILLALSLGLAFATKPTFLIWLFPVYFLFAFTVLLQKKLTVGIVIKSVLLLCVSLFLQIRWMLQNFELFGSFLGSYTTHEGTKLLFTNETFSPAHVLASVVKNIFLHLAFFTTAPSVQILLERGFAFLGVSLSDPRTTWYGSEFLVNRILYPQEDIMGNPIQMILILGITFWILFHFRKVQTKIIALFLSMWMGWLLFSLILKWQPYHSRLHLPFFAVLSSVAVGVLVEHFERYKRFLAVLSFVAYVLGVGVIIANTSRPYISYLPFRSLIQSSLPPGARIPNSFLFEERTAQYFHAKSERKDVSFAAVQALPSSVSGRVFLDPSIGFLYPYWPLIKKYRPQITVTGRAETADWKIPQDHQ